MTPAAWWTLAVVLVVLVVLVREVYRPVSALIGGLGLLFLVGSTPLLDEFFPAEAAFAGFANPATITIAALYVVATAVRSVGVVDAAVVRLLGNDAGRRSLLRLTLPVALASGVLNNTPIVATLAPVVRDWANARGWSPSKFLMPLSFAAILGGTLTTIGTSTTLVVSGIVATSQDLPPGQRVAFDLFEVTAVGLPVLVAGLAVVVLFSHRLLPDRHVDVGDDAEDAREYTFQMRVVAEGALEGRTVEEAGLRNLAGVYLVSIDRDDGAIAPVAPSQVLHGDDVLSFAGSLTDVRDLERTDGLATEEQEHLDVVTGPATFRYYEAVIGPESPLVRRSLAEAGFRTAYGAAVMAIHRAGERVAGKLGRVRLEVGDVLLLVGPMDFRREYDSSRDFLLVAPLSVRPAPPDPRRVTLVSVVVVAMVVAAGAGLVSILQSSLAAVLLLTVTGVLRLREARDSVDLDVVLVVASALGIGKAVEESGLARVIADGIGGVAEQLGDVGALALVMLATLVLTEVISNAAAAALMVPIAIPVAVSSGADPRSYAIAVAVMASASFLTPVGYQTNTIVYGLGGYRYTDYWRLGLPVAVSSFVITLVVVSQVV